jgi:hypothetical protein
MTTYLKALITAIAALARRAVGSETWALIVVAVQQADEMDSSGAEKKETVLEYLKRLAPSAAGWLLSMAVDIAVAKLRTAK